MTTPTNDTTPATPTNAMTTADTTNPLHELLAAAEGLALGGEVLVGFREGTLASITLTAEGTEVQVPCDDDPAWDWRVLTKTTRH